MSFNYLYALIPAAGVAVVYLVRKLREWQWGWVRNTSQLKDQIYIVTGANTGLGFETTKALLRRNATVIMACRDTRKAEEAVIEIRKSVPEGNFVSLFFHLLANC